MQHQIVEGGGIWRLEWSLKPIVEERNKNQRLFKKTRLWQNILEAMLGDHWPIASPPSIFLSPSLVKSYVKMIDRQYLQYTKSIGAVFQKRFVRKMKKINLWKHVPKMRPPIKWTRETPPRHLVCVYRHINRKKWRHCLPNNSYALLLQTVSLAISKRSWRLFGWHQSPFGFEQLDFCTTP